MTGAKKVVEVLRDRAGHLAARIESDDRDLTYDRRERRALLDAIEVVEAGIVPHDGTKLVVRPAARNTGELILIVDGEKVAHVIARRVGGTLVLEVLDEPGEGVQVKRPAANAAAGD